MTKERLNEVRKAVEILSKISDEEWKFLEQLLEDDVILNKNKCALERKKVTRLMKELGIPHKDKGFHYLRATLLYYMRAEDTSKILITREVYPKIAKEFKKSASSVERAIRVALESVCKTNNPKVQEIFGDLDRYKKGVPSNGEGIALLVEYLLRN